MFITTLTNSGVGPYLANFMAGHKPALYNDIMSRGPEFLREKYTPVDFGINPKPKLTDRQVIEAFIRERGLDPGRILREEARSDGFGEPHRIGEGIMRTENPDESLRSKRLHQAEWYTAYCRFADNLPDYPKNQPGGPDSL
jgi:hypothetical protein